MFAVLSVADMYNDATMKRHCTKFMIDNYDDVRNLKEYDDVLDELKEQITNAVAKKAKQQSKKEKQK